MSILGSLVYWLFLGCTAPLLYLLALLICLVTAPFDPTRALLHRYTCWWGTLYLRCLPRCRLVVEGRERIKPRTPYILVANHQHATDIMALSALGIPFKWVSKRQVFRIPFIGWNMYLNQYVRVDRGNRRTVRQTMETSLHWLRLGVPLLMFPEGTRSRTGEMQEFHRGAFKLAADAGCAVVPIVVEGTHRRYRGFLVRLHPETIHVRILDPITLEEAEGSVDGLKKLAYQRMKVAQEELRKAMASGLRTVGV